MDQSTSQEFPKIAMTTKRRPLRFLMLLLGIFLILGSSFFFVGRPPVNFSPGTMVTIPEGMSVREAGVLLQKSNIIRSESVFQFVVKIALADRPVIAGDFAFNAPYDVLRVARLVTGGGFGGTQVRITIPEGSSVREISSIVKRSIPGWNSDEFINNAKPFEGYLFPETYVVFKRISSKEMIEMLKKEYVNKMTSFKKDIINSKKTEAQIITMASLLEKEARNAEEAKKISGILWKRIAAGRPLQVDAPFLYVLGKTSAELTLKDLAKDGPYNTYTRKGLPVGPIGNPGISMITAALHPVDSPYWFYLHGSDGVIRYAKTYEEHLRNKKKYLP
jgi:UPF0755 protein